MRKSTKNTVIIFSYTLVFALMGSRYCHANFFGIDTDGPSIFSGISNKDKAGDRNKGSTSDCVGEFHLFTPLG